jgi:hypothetical protein
MLGRLYSYIRHSAYVIIFQAQHRENSGRFITGITSRFERWRDRIYADIFAGVHSSALRKVGDFALAPEFVQKELRLYTSQPVLFSALTFKVGRKI